LNQEWFWAAVIVAAPVVIFACLEIFSLIRRRRYAAVARRSKRVTPPSRQGRAG